MHVSDNLPVILVFVNDLLFYTKIEKAAEVLGYSLHWVERASQVGEGEDEPRRQPGESLSGRTWHLMDLVTRLHPALIIFDLGSPEFPWREWLPLLKTAPATRRVPVLCFGSHVDGETLKAAQSRGADGVVARSRFSAATQVLLEQYARKADPSTLQASCDQPISGAARHGLELFNHGEYFEAHEVLELAWKEDESPGRELYRAILQVAVAYLQIQRGNYRGAVKMFLRLRQWIDPLPDVCRGVNVARLRRDAAAAYEAMQTLGEAGIASFDPAFFKPVHTGF